MSTAAPSSLGARPRSTPDFRRSFLKTRLILGIIGLLLPFVLVLGATTVYDEPSVRDSLSAYYHSGMRNWFVGSLFAIGAGLLVYMADRRNQLDNVASNVAGCCAVLVALFPTNRPGDAVGPVATVHYTSAAVLFTLLGLMCFRFGSRDRREDKPRWGTLHHTCALLVWAAVAAIGLSHLVGVLEAWSTLAGEVVAVLAFAVSWFCKGSELLSVMALELPRPFSVGVAGARDPAGTA